MRADAREYASVVQGEGTASDVGPVVQGALRHVGCRRLGYRAWDKQWICGASGWCSIIFVFIVAFSSLFVFIVAVFKFIRMVHYLIYSFLIYVYA